MNEWLEWKQKHAPDKRVRTSIILDTAGNYQKDLAEMKEFIDHIMPVNFVAEGFDAAQVLKTPAELVVIDYGGMTQGYGTWGQCAAAVRAVVEWADSHPSGIVLFWTQYTAWIYEEEISDTFDPGKNKNIWFRAPVKGGGLITAMQTVDNKLRRWFGVG
jgi:hypothetical protein